MYFLFKSSQKENSLHWEVFTGESDQIFKEELIPILHSLFQKTEERTVPSWFHETNLPDTKTANYKPISLMKLYKIPSQSSTKSNPITYENIIYTMTKWDLTRYTKLGQYLNKQTNKRNLSCHQAKHVLSVNTEKASDKFTHPFIWKIISNLGIKRNYLNSIKVAFEEPYGQNHTSRWKTECVSTNIWPRQGCPLLPFLLNIELQ